MVRRFSLVLLAASLAVVLAQAKSATKGFQFFVPSAYDRKAEVLVSGKLRDYYVLEQGSRIDVTVQGPSRLRVLSRVVLASAVDSARYTYLALRNGSRKAISFVQESRATDKAAFAGGGTGVLAESRSRILDIPKGTQTYAFYLPKDSKERVLLRFALETNAFTEGTPVVAMTPAAYSTEVSLVTGEEVTSYFRVGGSDTVALRLVGPATLKVLSRVEFDEVMNGRQKWKVQVVEDGHIKGTYSLAAGRSEVTTYRKPAPLVPSRAETFYVEVPEGEHEYSLRVPENHRSVLLRFLLPRRQLERE